MIVCPRCGKENQDHYKFCLGCGAELPRDAEQPKSFSAPTPPGGTPAVAGGGGAPPPAAPQFGGAAAPPPAAPPPAAPSPAAPSPAASAGGPPPAAAPRAPGPPPAAPSAPPPAGPPPAVGGFGGPSPAPAGNGAPGAAATGGDTIDCPKCGTTNNKAFKFCGSCGQPLHDATAPAPAPAAPAPAPSGGGKGTLVLIRPDGTEGESLPFDSGTAIGRETTPQFASDSYLSPRHASFHFGGPTGLTVKDEGSLNGIYLRIDRDVPMELEDQVIFRVGQEIIRYEQLPEPSNAADGVEKMGSPREGLVGRICLLTGRETHGNCYAVPAEGLHLGRERGDILFPDDGYVSGLHARIHAEGGKVFLTDVGSSNGTFIRVDGQAPLGSGKMLLMGQQLFRVEF